MKSLVAIVSLVLASPTFAADREATLDEAFGIDLAVPESPAFDVLDVTPETVIRPASPKELATSLLNGVDRNGHFQTGLAIDTVPYLVTPLSNRVTLADYQRNPDGFNLYRLLGRTGLSIATVKGTDSEDEAWRLSAGLNITPYDAGDPRMDRKLQEGLRAIERKALDALAPQDAALTAAIVKLPDDVTDRILGLLQPNQPTTPEEWDAYEQTVLDTEAELRKIQTEHASDEIGQQVKLVIELLRAQHDTYKNQITLYAREAKRLREEAKQRNWKASSWQMGASPRWLSESGAIDELQGDGGAFWTSLALGTQSAPSRDADPVAWMWDSSQLIFHLRGRLDADVPDPRNGGDLRSQDDVLAGLRLRVGLHWIAFNASGAFLHVNPEHARAGELARYSLGVNIRIAEDWWIELVGGGQSGGNDNEDQGFVLSSIKFAMPEGRELNLPGM